MTDTDTIIDDLYRRLSPKLVRCPFCRTPFLVIGTEPIPVHQRKGRWRLTCPGSGKRIQQQEGNGNE